MPVPVRSSPRRISSSCAPAVLTPARASSIRARLMTPRRIESPAVPIASRSAPIRPMVSAPCLNDASASGSRWTAAPNCAIGARRLSPSRSACSWSERADGSSTRASRSAISSSRGPITSARRSAIGFSSPPTRGRTCSTTQRSTRAKSSSDRRKTRVCTSIKAALRNRASSVLSNAICKAAVTPVRFDRNPSSSLTIGRTSLIFMSAREIPSTVPMKPITGSR